MSNLNRANSAISKMFSGFTQKRKICSTCKELKTLSEFHKHSKANDGLQSSCKQCQSRRVKADYRLKKASLVTCKQCERTIDSSLFYNKRKGEGKMSICKDCYGKNTSLGMLKSKKVETPADNLFEPNLAGIIAPIVQKCLEKIDDNIIDLLDHVIEAMKKGTK